jgi:hypothetical protein
MLYQKNVVHVLAVVTGNPKIHHCAVAAAILARRRAGTFVWLLFFAPKKSPHYC